MSLLGDMVLLVDCNLGEDAKTSKPGSMDPGLVVRVTVQKLCSVIPCWAL